VANAHAEITYKLVDLPEICQ